MVKKKKKSLLSHHRHTGKVLPKQHTAYPVLAMMLLLVGAILGYTTFQVHADSLVVNATVFGSPPPSAAVILSPQDNDHFSAIPIAVSGTCPAGYIVKLFRNATFSGSATCQSDGTFSIQTDLFVGRNDLAARIFNLGNQEGPTSPIVTVYYDPPQPPATAPPSSPPTAPGQPAVNQPFFITTDYVFQATYDEQEIAWDFGIVGGEQPYNAEIDWGDGTTSTIKEIVTDQFTARHTYKKGSGAQEYNTVTVTLTDARNDTATLQVFVILNNRLDTAAAGAGAGVGLPPNSEALTADGAAAGIVPKALKKFLTYAVPTFAVTALLTASFWIGQWQAAAAAGKHLPIQKLIFHKWH